MPTVWTSRYHKKTGKPMCGRQVQGRYVCQGSVAAAVGTEIKCPHCHCWNVVAPKPEASGV